MDSKITIVKLARLLAAKTGSDPAVCEEVVRRLFKEVGNTLRDGESVKVKGLGIFKVSMVKARKSVDINSGEDNDIPAHNRITFIPDRELAAAVNAPFEMFDTVVLSEKVSEEDLRLAEDDTELPTPHSNPLDADTPLPTAEKASSPAEKETQTIQPATEITESEITESENTESENTESENSENTKSEITESENSENTETETDDTQSLPAKKHNKKWWWYLIAGIIVLLIAAGCLWTYDSDHTLFGLLGNKNPLPETEITAGSIPEQDIIPAINDTASAIVDSIDTSDENTAVEEASDKPAEKEANSDPVPTKASDAPIYDIVTDTRYLSTIAKEHYGNFNLWPYIYKENEKILGHPNRIRPGTKIVVPPLSKYNIDPKNKKDIDKAKKLGVEIYRKYSGK
ncbi:MAG: HU family DNA-binding protein [Muribaculaceae bacterium]|nr:HU family DNA-binding protein [Muribaculaceae bacterium]